MKFVVTEFLQQDMIRDRKGIDVSAESSLDDRSLDRSDVSLAALLQSVSLEGFSSSDHRSVSNRKTRPASEITVCLFTIWNL